MFWTYEVLTNSLLSFSSERSIMEKERASGSYRLSAYFLAKSLSEAPMKLVLPTTFLIISFWMANISSNFAIFLGILGIQMMLFLVSESLGVLLSALFRDLSKAPVITNVLLVFVLLAGGYYIHNAPDWLIVWTKWLSFFKYAYDACLQLQFMGGVMICVIH